MEGKPNEAWISYNSTSLNLSVGFTGFNNESVLQQHLSTIIDLRLLLPEWVTVGFSAATGKEAALFTLNSWEFNSTLELETPENNTRKRGNPVARSPTSNIAPGPGPGPKSKNNTGLAVGLGVGGFVLICVLGLVSIGLWKNKFNKGTEEEDDDLEEYMGEDFERGAGPRRDIKSNNVLLDSDFNAKLGDFGLARLVDHAKGAQTTALAGTLGYMAPECATTGRASKESDVYSFGVVALEIACGRKPIISLNAQENEINIVNWVWGFYGRGRIVEAADPRLGGNFEEHQIKCLMIVGLWCAHPDHNNRPSISQAIQVLNLEAPLPNLPSSLPVPTYLEHPLNSSLAAFNISASGEGQNQIIRFSSNTNSSLFTSSSDEASTSVSLLHSR
ncbi:hypothetical protein VNO77_05177 [Canavalia gladiata]|uniref:Protein kinase domain-containing protein n=1 Tax=Canavalia gladiata TaxID=3824 RepID=A0AAN9RDX6_CANGL